MPSLVWAHFQKIDDVTNQCHYCDRKLKCHNSTTPMLNHLKRAHVTVLPKQIQNSVKTMKAEKAAAPTKKKNIIESSSEGEESSGDETTHHDVSRRSQTKDMLKSKTLKQTTILQTLIGASDPAQNTSSTLQPGPDEEPLPSTSGAQDQGLPQEPIPSTSKASHPDLEMEMHSDGHGADVDIVDPSFETPLSVTTETFEKKSTHAARKRSRENQDDLPTTVPSPTAHPEAVPGKAKKMKMQQTKMQQFTTIPMSQQRQEQLTNILAEMIAIDLLPVSLVNGTGFHKFINALEPRYKIPVPATVMKRLKVQANEVCIEMDTRLQTAEAKSITTDLWTSKRTESFLIATAHYITLEFELETETLSAEPMPERHTISNLRLRLEKKVVTWNMEGEVIATVHDNARNITGAVIASPLLGHSHPCACHTLQLSIKVGVKQAKIKKAVKTVKKIVRFFKKSTVGKPALLKAMATLKLSCTELVQDTDIRWNTTCEACEKVLSARQAIQLVLNDSSVVNTDVASSLELTNAQWELLADTVKVLKPLKTVTELLSGESYVTISLVRPLIKNIIQSLERSDTDKLEIAKLKECIQKDLEKRFHFVPGAPEEVSDDDVFLGNADDGSDVEFEEQMLRNDTRIAAPPLPTLPTIANITLTIAHIAPFFDPRFKSLPFEEENIKTSIHEEVKSMIKKLMDCNKEQPKEKQSDTLTKLDLVLGKSQPQELPSVSEFDMYLNEPGIGHNSDPLKWWKGNFIKFPNIARLARMFLCIPASSVPSERSCSSAGNLLRTRRLSLLAENASIMHLLYENSMKRKLVKKKH